MNPRPRLFAALATLALVTTATPALADDDHRFGSKFVPTMRGPSTATDPYLIPAATGVQVASILTVNDAGSASNGYEMVGIPDGIGVMPEDGKVVALVSHEIRDNEGITRRHGQRGAFVARFVIDPGTLAVTHGSDLAGPGVRYWDYPAGAYVTSGARFSDSSLQDLSFGRFCSGTLSDPGAFYTEALGVGYQGQIYFGNEEDGDAGRSFGFLTDGTVQALPRLGLFSWENTVPANNAGLTTLVMGQEDGPRDGSQPWVYVGTKQTSGNAFDRAGLTNGRNFVLDAVDPLVTSDLTWRATYATGVAAAVRLSEIPWNQTGAAQNVEGKAEGLSLNRIEDGHWDRKNPNDFYFLTTEGGDRATTFPFLRDGGGLWLLHWADIDQPELGATLTLLLDGSEEIDPGEPKLHNPDNMVLDRHGNVLIQEDPGNNAHLARIVAYRIKDGALGVVARFDPSRFSLGGSRFITQDEESSGIVDTEKLFGPRTFLFDAQIHSKAGLPAGTGPNTVEEYVENGQLLLLKVSSWHEVYGDSDEDAGD
jgi:hypothetical protein